jgi:hypothetical protein
MTEQIRELDQPVRLGEIAFRHGDNRAYAKYDRMAKHSGELMLASLVAEPAKLKAIRAMLSPKLKGRVSIEARGAGWKRPSDQEYARTTSQGWMNNTEEGYDFHVSKLEYGLCQAVVVTRNPSFLLCLTPEALWRRLQKDDYTTPLLRTWMPYVTRRLIDERLLVECYCVRVECGWLRHVPQHLDTIVSDGLKAKEILIAG